MTGNDFAVYAIALVVVAVMVYHLFSIPRARKAIMEAAKTLKLGHSMRSLLDIGSAHGTWNKRFLTLSAKQLNRSQSKGSSMATIISLSCIHKAGPLEIYGNFFKKFPDWRSVYAYGRSEGKGGLIKMLLLGPRKKVDEKKRFKIEGLFRSFSSQERALLSRARLNLEPHQIEFSSYSLLYDPAQIKTLVLLLERLANRLERLSCDI